MSSILDWFTPTRWIILGVVVLALLSSVLGYGAWCAHGAREAERQKWELAIAKIQTEAATKLATETRKVLDLERQIADSRQRNEDDYETRRIQSRASGAHLAAAAAAGGGRLWDPAGERGCRGDGAQAGPGPAAGGGAADPAQAPGVLPGGAAGVYGGFLSAPLTALLIRITAEADEINDAYSLCRADSIDLRKKLNDWRGAGGP